MYHPSLIVFSTSWLSPVLLVYTKGLRNVSNGRGSSKVNDICGRRWVFRSLPPEIWRKSTSLNNGNCCKTSSNIADVVTLVLWVLPLVLLVRVGSLRARIILRLLCTEQKYHRVCHGLFACVVEDRYRWLELGLRSEMKQQSSLIEEGSREPRPDICGNEYRELISQGLRINQEFSKSLKSLRKDIRWKRTDLWNAKHWIHRDVSTISPSCKHSWVLG